LIIFRFKPCEKRSLERSKNKNTEKFHFLKNSVYIWCIYLINYNITTLGLKLRKLRELHNFKQEYVGSVLGLTQTEYSKIENDEIENINLKHLQKLSELYNISLSQLFDWDGKFQIGAVYNHDNGVGVGINHGTINHNDLSHRLKEVEEKLAMMINRA
jgi:transcriptional regulator with XRE-family HTH domain